MKLYKDLLPKNLFSVLVQSNGVLMSNKNLLHVAGNCGHDVVLICHKDQDGEELGRDWRCDRILQTMSITTAIN